LRIGDEQHGVCECYGELHVELCCGKRVWQRESVSSCTCADDERPIYDECFFCTSCEQLQSASCSVSRRDEHDEHGEILCVCYDEICAILCVCCVCFCERLCVCFCERLCVCCDELCGSDGHDDGMRGEQLRWDVFGICEELFSNDGDGSNGCVGCVSICSNGCDAKQF